MDQQVLDDLAHEAELTFTGNLPLHQLPIVVAAELERHAEQIRGEAQYVGNGWDARETFRAAELYVRLRLRAEHLRMAGEALARKL